MAVRSGSAATQFGVGSIRVTDESGSAAEEPAPGRAEPFSHPSLAVFVLLAKFLGIPADPEQIAHDRGKGDDPYSLEDLNRIARKLGLIARLRGAVVAELRKLPLPALIETANG